MKKVIIFLLTIIFSLLYLSLPALAQTPSPQPTVILPKAETVNRDYFAAGQTVILSGTVNGDAYVAGGNIIVEGTINGDLLAAGGTITVRGQVSNNVRIVGGEVNIEGSVGRSISIAGGNISISKAATIGNSVAVASGNLLVFAPITRDLNVAGGQVTVGNSVGGDIMAAAGQILLTSQANVKGNINYWSNRQASIQPGATVSGQTTQHQPMTNVQGPKPEDARRTAATLGLFGQLIRFISYLILGWLLLRLLPNMTARTVATIRTQPGMSLLVGFLTSLLFPLVFLLLIMTIIGIPIAFLLLAIFLVLWFLAPLFVALLIGQRIVRNSIFAALVVGLLIYELLAFIPIIGWIAMALAVWFGLGGILIEDRNTYRDLRSKDTL